MKIYTKTGDKGETSLFGGKRVLKSDSRVEAYGTVDELNSAIGVVTAQISNIKNKKDRSKIKNELIRIQNDLLDIGSILATPSYSSSERRESRSTQGNGSRQARTISYLTQRTETLEKIIDDLTSKMPELTHFILPGGGKTGSRLHFCRTICRRAERRIVELSNKESVDREIIQYFNRLSDLFFTMARFVNYKEKKKEVIWKSKFKSKV